MNVEGTPLFFSAPRAVRVGNKAQRKKERMDIETLADKKVDVRDVSTVSLRDI